MEGDLCRLHLCRSQVPQGGATPRHATVTRATGPPVLANV